MEEAVRSIGTKLKIGSMDPVEVAGLTSISGPNMSADTIDVTTLDSAGGYREFIGGFKDGGEVSVEGYFTNETGKGQAELYVAYESGAVTDFVIEFPPALNAKWTFKGVVTAFETSAGVEDPIGFSATIKVSGAPVLSTLTP